MSKGMTFRMIMVAVAGMWFSVLTFTPTGTFAASNHIDYAAADAYVEAQMQAWRIPGAALVITRDGQAAHLQAFGTAGLGRLVTLQTPFEIGSCSKSFTALAVMQLVEAGEIDLDTPVQQYLPWFRVADTAVSTRITLRHLLNHTSGLSTEGTNSLTMINPDGKTLEEQVRSISGLAITAAPGTRYQYSNFNYMTLALVIETVTGHSYGDYLRQNIFTPLDMQDSFTDPAKASAHGLSDGHTWWFGFPFESLEGPRPDMLGAGYILVSPEDMSHYLIAQLSDGVYEEAQILSPENIDAMHTPAQLPEGASVYGMGWVSYDEDGLSVVNHNGQSASFTCSMILLPERGIGIAVLTNVSSLLGPHAAWSLADNVKNILVTGQPARADSAFRDFYLPWDGGFLLATGALLWSLISMLFRGQKIAKSQSRWRVALSFFVDGLLMLVAFFGLPLVLGWTKWRGMFVWQPDAVYWCLWAGILLLAKMSLRAAILVRRGKQNHS